MLRNRFFHLRAFVTREFCRPLPLLVALLGEILACNSPTDATRANFSKAISEFVETTPENIAVDSFTSPQLSPSLGTFVKVKFHFSDSNVSSGSGKHESTREAVLVLTDHGWRHATAVRTGSALPH